MRRMSIRQAARRRLSQAVCPEDLDDDSSSFVSFSSPSEYESADEYEQFQLWGDDSDAENSSKWSGSDRDELEGMYGFDEAKIAEFLDPCKPIDQKELEDVIESSMKETFLSRQQLHGYVQDSDDDLAAEHKPMAGPLSGRMTPGKGTPEMTPSATPKMTPRGESLTLPATCPRMSLVAASAINSRARRSSMILTNKRLSLAVDKVIVAQQVDLENAKEKILTEQLEQRGEASREMVEAIETETAMLKKNRRKSLFQAAEVVGLAAAAAGIDEEPSDDGETSAKLEEQLRIVQRAVEGARRKHRQSIAQVAKVAQAAGEFEQQTQIPDDSVDGSANTGSSTRPHSMRKRLDDLASLWRQQEAARRKQMLEAPSTKRAGRGKQPHAGYLALLCTDAGSLTRRPERCTNRQGMRSR